MFKKALISGLFFCLLHPLKAQFSVDTVYVQHEVPKTEGVFYSTIELINKTDTALTVEWQVVKQDLPFAWTSTYTVGFDWYEDTVLSGTYSLLPSDSVRSFVVVQFYPNNVADTGNYEMKFWLSTDTAVSYTLHFRGIAYTAPNSVEEVKRLNGVYPNPLVSGQTLKGLQGYCEIYSSSGALFWKGDAAEIPQLSKPGIYLIKRQSDENSNQTLRLVVLP